MGNTTLRQFISSNMVRPTTRSSRRVATVKPEETPPAKKMKVIKKQKKVDTQAKKKIEEKTEKKTEENVDEKAEEKTEKKTEEKVEEKTEVKVMEKTEEKVMEKTTVAGKASNLKITSWNVNGIRANLKKDGLKWLLEDSADIICLQETKCSKEDMPAEVKNAEGYHVYWNEANKKGYSGVAILSKVEALNVKFGIGVEEHDQEGRTVTAEYEKFFVVNSYVPNSQNKLARLPYRLTWNAALQSYLNGLNESKKVILCGDLNVSHLEIDLANPKSNTKNAGFTKQERDGMTELLNAGYIDSFRHLYPEVIGKYTFWTYFKQARSKNVGWRLDYFILSKNMQENLCDSIIVDSVLGSDHCPISLLLAM